MPATSQANFAFDPVKLADFTYLSEHRALPFGKELIRKFYGTAPGKSYFEGCSSGGHDAMMLSQRWPNDFDGIVARGPATSSACTCSSTASPRRCAIRPAC